jgi:hypothetical protein
MSFLFLEASSWQYTYLLDLIGIDQLYLAISKDISRLGLML